MILYHASYRLFEVGQVYIAETETPYFLENIAKGNDWVDLFLNEHKPEYAPVRQQTFFACDSVENCYAFISNRPVVGVTPIYYMVEMENPVKCVMCLTDIFRHIERGDPKHSICAKEYWVPTLEWKYYEFLSDRMKILEIVAEPEDMLKYKGKMNYSNDRELRKRTFGY